MHAEQRLNTVSDTQENLHFPSRTSVWSFQLLQGNSAISSKIPHNFIAVMWNKKGFKVKVSFKV